MTIESRGLDPVPQSEKTSSGADLFAIWAGASVCLPAFILGAILIPSFSWYEAMSINLLGNLLVGVFIVLGGCFGVKTGFPAVVLGRQVFGAPLGHWLPTLGILTSMIGWSAVITAMTGIAIDMLVRDLTGFSAPTLCILLVGILNATTAVSGYRNIRWFSWFTLPIMIGVCIYLGLKMLNLNDLAGLLDYQKHGGMTYGEGLNLVIGGSLSGALIASDFSRYVRHSSQNWWGTLTGTFLVSFLLGMLGMLSQAATGNWNPLLIVQTVGASPLLFFFLVIGNWSTNDNLLYSSGLALTNVLPGPGRYRNTIFGAALAAVLAAVGLANVLEYWLNFLSWFLSPMLGVVYSDYFIIKARKAGSHINKKAVLAVAGGILTAVLTPDAWVPSVTGMASSALLYLLFMKNQR